MFKGSQLRSAGCGDNTSAAVHVHSGCGELSASAHSCDGAFNDKSSIPSSISGSVAEQLTALLEVDDVLKPVFDPDSQPRRAGSAQRRCHSVLSRNSCSSVLTVHHTATSYRVRGMPCAIEILFVDIAKTVAIDYFEHVYLSYAK